MGLKTDISNAFLKMMSNGGTVDLSEDQIENVDNFALEMTEAFKQFLTKQIWQITDMVAFVELDEFETELPQTADVLPSVTTTVTGGSATGGPITGTGAVTTGTKGVTIPAIKFNKNGSPQGGRLKGIGHAYLGGEYHTPSLMEEWDTPGDNEGWNSFSRVRLNYDDIEADE